jgi:rSAM/selenodomain-associated transferase 2/rSAM/selenodomain-associated transferase 1
MISVIIPTFNEAPHLERLLPNLVSSTAALELIVADGGSTDRSREFVASCNDVIWVSTEKGRATQMNAGAEAASGKVLFFLHADCQPLQGWSTAIESAITEPAFGVGAFRFALDEAGVRPRIVEWGVRFRSEWLGLPYGDQGLFLAAEAFRNAGGFPDVPIMEDVLLVQRMKRTGTLTVLRLPLKTSARRWRRNGYARQTWMNVSTYFQFRLGVPVEKLAARYASAARAVIVFCKYPVAGHVKTRLAESIGGEEAIRVYRRMVRHTLRVTRGMRSRAQVLLFFSPPEAMDSMREWLGRSHRYVPQSDGDLGDRMSQAFEYANRHGHGRTLIVGTDCPGLLPSHLDQAFAALQNHDVVIGPTEDGGYFLIGSSRPHPALFRDIAWSTGSVCRQTLKIAESESLRVAKLDTLRDVDTIEDLNHYRMDRRAGVPKLK